MEKISLEPPAEMIQNVADAVASGKYGSADELVLEALRNWVDTSPIPESEVGRLKRAWQEGLDSGPMMPLDFEDVRRKARARLAEIRSAAKR